MSDSAMQAPGATEVERVATALTRWAADPRLTPLAVRAGTMLLVLDMAGQRILHASDSAGAVRAAIADSAGRVFRQLGLPAQLAQLGGVPDRPRLVRLRLDTRGLAPAVTCLVARGDVDESSCALLLAPIGPVTGLRRPPDRDVRSAPQSPAAASRTTLPPAIPDNAIVALASRVIWHSDSKGVLNTISGASQEVADALEGRSWMALCSAGLAPGSEAAFNALKERQTFRGLSLILDCPETGDEIEMEFSGAPSGRPSQPFAGFHGFGSVRGRRKRSHATTAPEANPASHHPENGDTSQRVSSLPEQMADGDGTPDEARVAETLQVVPTAATQDGADLSSNEHDAFREIARALGARFAGDDEPDTPDGDSRLGSVTPFPVDAAAPLERRRNFDATVAGALDQLPTGMLVHDGHSVLFVNRWLRDHFGLSDTRAVEAAGWLTWLIAHSSTPRAEYGVTLETTAGNEIALQVEQSGIEWQGRPATIVLARQANGGERDEARSKRGFVTLDAQGRVLTLDPAAAALVAAGRNDVVGEPFADLFPPESARRIEESLRQARERETSEPREVEGRAGNAPIPLSLRVARLLSTGETAYRATLVQIAEARRDAEEQREAVLRVEASARRKFDYVARAGQAIRAPVSGILNIAAAMREEPFGPLGGERYRDHLRDIHASGEEALALINDLVDLARIDAGRIDLAFTDVPLNEIVSGCIASIQSQAARERIVVRTSLSPDLKTLVADERSMRQATMNAISNAVRLSDPGGQVIVTTTVADRGEIALRVRDTGSGLSAEEIELALDPFSRDGRPDARFAFGGGLGLSLSKALVEANRGRFSMTSRRNEGTLVEFVFPAPHARTA